MIIRKISNISIMVLFLLIGACKQKEVISFDGRLIQNSENGNLVFKNLPQAQGVITDLESVFTEVEKKDLYDILNNYEKQTGREIAILTTPSFLDYDNTLDYASDVGNYWGVGKATKNNGLLIVISATLRKTAISSGYGTEKDLSNKYLKSVIDSIMIPKFKDGAYYEGVLGSIDDIKTHWKSE